MYVGRHRSSTLKLGVEKEACLACFGRTPRAEDGVYTYRCRPRVVSLLASSVLRVFDQRFPRVIRKAPQDKKK